MSPQEAGYSGTPLFKKLGIKEGFAVLFVDAPRGWEVPDLPEGSKLRRATSKAKPNAADVVVAFFDKSETLRTIAPKLAEGLTSKASLWIAWPRRAGGHVSDITDSVVREVLLATGVVDVKVAALDDDWSGLKFVWRLENRASRV